MKPLLGGWKSTCPPGETDTAPKFRFAVPPLLFTCTIDWPSWKLVLAKLCEVVAPLLPLITRYEPLLLPRPAGEPPIVRAPAVTP